MLLPELLVPTNTVLVVSFDLPVLIRVKLKIVVHFIVALIVIAVMSENFE